MGKPGFPIPLLEGYAIPPPPAGGGVGKPGFPTPLLRGTIFTLAVHAASPHTDGMNIPLGRAVRAQTLPPGEGMGKPGFPIPLIEGYALSRMSGPPRTGLYRDGLVTF